MYNGGTQEYSGIMMSENPLALAETPKHPHVVSASLTLEQGASG